MLAVFMWCACFHFLGCNVMLRAPVQTQEVESAGSFKSFLSGIIKNTLPIILNLMKQASWFAFFSLPLHTTHITHKLNTVDMCGSQFHIVEPVIKRMQTKLFATAPTANPPGYWKNISTFYFYYCSLHLRDSFECKADNVFKVCRSTNTPLFLWYRTTKEYIFRREKWTKERRRL